MNKTAAIAIAAALLVAGIGAYVVTQGDDGGGHRPDTAGQQVVDAVGRTVTVPDTLEGGIVTVGSTGPLRFLSCFDVYDLVIEVDEGDVKDRKNGRAYSYAYPYDKLTRYHADNALEAGTAEAIGNLNPSLVIIQESVWNGYMANCVALSSKCTVAVIKAQDLAVMWDDGYKLSKDLVDTFNLLGTLLGKEGRAAEVIGSIESILADIRSLTGVSTEDVYVAGVTISGSNALNATFPIYLPLSLVGGVNAYKDDVIPGRVVVNHDKFSNMDIDLVVIDPSSSDKIAEQDSQLVLEYLYKRNGGDPADRVRLYVTVPIVWDSINYDCVLASAYYMAHILYGVLTHDEVVERIGGVFAAFYGEEGENVFKDMSDFFVQKSAENGAELPLLGEVEIVHEGGAYRIVAA
ncbi:MAG: hypothetical protein FWH47_04245 [Methanomassiliicoccaceae archaeon]|nr:hypothetical protein [Methanomassiliicoccaceae archaeon]